MPDAPPRGPGRRGYLDWLRGLAVLIMIEAHLLDSWTRFPDREHAIFGWSMVLGGLGAPLFLFLAGASVSLAAASRLRKSGDAAQAWRSVAKRGLQIFALAFLFRLQAVILSWGSWWHLLKVDILNIMGPAIAAAAVLWGACRSPRARLLAFGAATLLVAAVTPPVRATPALDFLPDPVEAYIRPRAGLTNFIFFPWMAFVFAGAFAGVLVDGARTALAERRLNLWFAVGGAVLAVGAFAASYLPTPYASSHFWSTSPAFFFLRTGILIALIGVAYAWERRPGGLEKWSPLQQLGRSSLFVYWIHIELIYGLVVRPLHKTFSLPAAWFAVLWFAALMLLVSLAKDRAVRWWKSRALIPGHAR